ncbi:MAG TPA: DNA-processing protein DprA [bacterium]|nr:DNA-processing protein DprA [bacterium]HNT64612.1 DNA-processing protein DprA [bacterium]
MTEWSAEELFSLFRLISVPRIGPHKIRLLLQRFQSPSAVLRAPLRQLVQVHGIEQTLAEYIKNEADSRFAEKQMHLLQKSGTKLLTFWDAGYPSILKEIYDPPLVLYFFGVLDSKTNLAIVGTRKPSAYGATMVEKFSRELIQRGYTLVSGLARGIDTLVHRTCVQAQAATIAVLGSGCDQIYPPENRSLAEALVAAGGAVVSEYPLGTLPEAMNFPRRNRIISGLSKAVLVIEAGESSGALITADFAVEQGREVMALPGNINSEKSSGTNMLIQQGAKLVRSVDDIVEEIEPQGTRAPAGQQLPLLTLDEDEEKVLSRLTDQPQQIDILLRMGDFPVNRLHTLLLNLELKGVIKQLPGKFYIRT